MRTARRSCSRRRPKASRRRRWSARIAAERPRYLQGYHISFDHWHSTHSPENTELSQEIYRRLKAAGLITTRTIEQFFDPVKAMFLADRYIKGECPVCHAKDQYGDACEVCSSVYSPTDLIEPYSTLTGATPVLRSSEHYFFRLVGSALPCVPRASGSATISLQPEVGNKAREWLGGNDGGTAAILPAAVRPATNLAGARPPAAAPASQTRRAGGLGHLPRRALLRHPDP